MKKSISLYILIIIFCYTGISHAADIVDIGFGLHIGAQHDVGNFGSNDPSIQIDPQNNYFLGFSSKSNFFSFLFIKLGVDSTLLINKGEVLENSSAEIESLKIHYVSIPLFLGFNYKIMDVGNFYMGPGLAYLLGRGRITCTAPALSDDIDTNTWGYGFIAGIELELTSSIRFYFELEYLDGRSTAVQQTQSSNEWKNFYINYSGPRLILGIMYYVI